jgi:hypothetical protein
MSIQDIFKKNLKVETATKKELEVLSRDFRRLKFDLQSSIDTMTGEEAASLYGANKYKTYAGAVDALNKKYQNESDWGNGLAANIIDFRAAVTVSSGPQYKPAKNSTIQQKDEDGKSIGKDKVQAFEPAVDIEEDATTEMDFCRSFFDVNDINHEAPQELGREAEIEGRVAVTLDWDEAEQQVIMNHRPWLSYKYKETRSKSNKKIIESIKWDANESEGIQAGEAKGDLLVCRWFGGRRRAKDPMPKVARCLTQIDYVDQAFRDWREIDRLYVAPIPVFECKTPEEAEEMNDRIKAGLNFKIKKAWAVVGNFKFAGPDMSGIDSLEREIKRQSCFIAGTTGYPLQFLLPDMLSNRSTSENIMESALVHTASERAIWTGFYEELISKAMKLYTIKTSKTALDPNKLSITISLMTQEQWNRLTNFWLPAFKDDLVTREAVLPQIPDFNIQEELDRRTEADNSKVKQITQELDQVQREADMATKGQTDKGAGVVPQEVKNDFK